MYHAGICLRKSGALQYRALAALARKRARVVERASMPERSDLQGGQLHREQLLRSAHAGVGEDLRRDEARVLYPGEVPAAGTLREQIRIDFCRVPIRNFRKSCVLLHAST